MPACRIVKNIDFEFTYYSCGTTVKKHLISQSSSIATLLQCLLYSMYTLPTLNAQLGGWLSKENYNIKVFREASRCKRSSTG